GPDAFSIYVDSPLTYTGPGPSPYPRAIGARALQEGDYYFDVSSSGDGGDYKIGFLITPTPAEADRLVSATCPKNIAFRQTAYADIFIQNLGYKDWSPSNNFSLAVIQDSLGLVPATRFPVSAVIPKWQGFVFHVPLVGKNSGHGIAKFRMVDDSSNAFG